MDLQREEASGGYCWAAASFRMRCAMRGSQHKLVSGCSRSLDPSISELALSVSRSLIDWFFDHPHSTLVALFSLSLSLLLLSILAGCDDLTAAAELADNPRLDQLPPRSRVSPCPPI